MSMAAFSSKDALPITVRPGPTTKLLHKYKAVLPALSFCASSLAMIMLNKAAMSTFRLQAPACLVLFQCAMTPVYVLLWCSLGFHDMPQLDTHTLIMWFPVNAMFVGMIWTSFLALKNIGIATCTVLKNLTNFLVIVGDYACFNLSYPFSVWLTLVLMLFSALCSAATDLEFNVEGYVWQLINNVFTAAYSLWLRSIIIKMEQQRSKGGGSSRRGVDEMSLVMYNNVVSTPLLLVIVFVTGDAHRLLHDPVLYNVRFQLVAVVSSIVGFLISLSSMWFLSTTTATTFSLVGSLNKIPMALIGMILFQTPVSASNLASIGIGLAAGVLFVYTKSQTKSSH